MSLFVKDIVLQFVNRFLKFLKDHLYFSSCERMFLFMFDYDSIPSRVATKIFEEFGGTIFKEFNIG